MQWLWLAGALSHGSHPMTTIERPSSPTRSYQRCQHGAPQAGCFDAPVRESDVLVLESCHSTWIFDPTRLRFRRILKGVQVGRRPVATQWRPYWQVLLDPEGEGFTVFLNESRTRVIRSWRHAGDCAACGRSDDTAELSLENIRLTLHGYGG
jgi:hypothetical protein